MPAKRKRPPTRVAFRFTGPRGRVIVLSGPRKVFGRWTVRQLKTRHYGSASNAARVFCGVDRRMLVKWEKNSGKNQPIMIRAMNTALSIQIDRLGGRARCTRL